MLIIMYKLPEALSSISSFSQPSTAESSQRPRTLHVSKSFSRLEPPKNTLPRNRASTVQNIPEVPATKALESNNEDLFDKDIAEESLEDEQDVCNRQLSN